MSTHQAICDECGANGQQRSASYLTPLSWELPIGWVRTSIIGDIDTLPDHPYIHKEFCGAGCAGLWMDSFASGGSK